MGSLAFIASKISQRFHSSANQAARVKALLDITSIFGNELPTNYDFVEAIIQAYQRLELVGAKQTVSELVN